MMKCVKSGFLVLPADSRCLLALVALFTVIVTPVCGRANQTAIALLANVQPNDVKSRQGALLVKPDDPISRSLGPLSNVVWILAFSLLCFVYAISEAVAVSLFNLYTRLTHKKRSDPCLWAEEQDRLWAEEQDRLWGRSIPRAVSGYPGNDRRGTSPAPQPVSLECWLAVACQEFGGIQVKSEGGHRWEVMGLVVWTEGNQCFSSNGFSVRSWPTVSDLKTMLVGRAVYLGLRDPPGDIDGPKTDVLPPNPETQRLYGPRTEPLGP